MSLAKDLSTLPSKLANFEIIKECCLDNRDFCRSSHNDKKIIKCIKENAYKSAQYICNLQRRKIFILP